MEVMNRKYILIGLLVCITGIFSGCHSWLDVQPEDQDKMIIHIDPGIRVSHCSEWNLCGIEQ